jgi:hypothetical protein
MPASLLAYKEMLTQGSKKDIKVYNTLFSNYQESYTFILTILPVSEKPQSDIMYYDIQEEETYKSRFRNLNFNLKELFSLKIGDELVHPDLYTFENTYSLSKGRSIFLVFNKHNFKNKPGAMDKADLIFNDEVFRTGINHFVFDFQKLQSIPEIDLNS